MRSKVLQRRTCNFFNWADQTNKSTVLSLAAYPLSSLLQLSPCLTLSPSLSPSPHSPHPAGTNPSGLTQWCHRSLPGGYLFWKPEFWVIIVYGKSFQESGKHMWTWSLALTGFNFESTTSKQYLLWEFSFALMFIYLQKWVSSTWAWLIKIELFTFPFVRAKREKSAYFWLLWMK